MKRIIILALILSLVIFTGCDDEKNTKKLITDSANLKSTIITPHLKTNVIPGKNIIYCSTFQLAWNELRDNIVKEDILLENNPLDAVILNKKLTTRNDLNEKDYYAIVGFGKENIVETIRKDLKEKFKDKDTLGPTFEPKGNDILAYAYLYKQLKFPHEFISDKDPISFQDNHIKSFGLNNEVPNFYEIAKQIRIIDYKSNEDFIIRIDTESINDDLILAKVAPGFTLLDTINKVNKRISNGENLDFTKEDILKIPSIEFDVNHTYKQFIDKKLLNYGFQDYFISHALQNIDFSFNEKGAIVESQGEIGVQKAFPITQHKKLVFDKHFLLYIKKKGSNHPFLALWIDNPEILMKVNYSHNG